MRLLYNGGKVEEHQNEKRLTTFALVIALMTGSVAQLAVLLYRGARLIAVSSLALRRTSRTWLPI